MKYEKVASRSTTTTTAAVSHQSRRRPWACPAATRLASVKRVSGIVVTNAQNLRPLSGDRRESGGELAHRGTTILASYRPAPKTIPRLMTRSHSKTAAKFTLLSLTVGQAVHARTHRGEGLQ